MKESKKLKGKSKKSVKSARLGIAEGEAGCNL